MSMPSMLALAEDAPHDIIAVDADAGGIAVDPRTRAIHVADRTTGAVTLLGGARDRCIVGPGNAGLDALTTTPDGTLYATRPGHGHAGAVVRIERDGAVARLPRLAVEVARLGILYDAADHALYTTQFHVSPRGAYDGSVVLIDLATGEPSTVIDGFGQPVGIAKLGAVLVIADARQRAVFRVDLVAGRAVRRLQLTAEHARPGAICALGPDAVLVTTFDAATQRGEVRRIDLEGRSTVLAHGAWEPRGIATDGDHAWITAGRTGEIRRIRVGSRS